MLAKLAAAELEALAAACAAGDQAALDRVRDRLGVALALETLDALAGGATRAELAVTAVGARRHGAGIAWSTYGDGAWGCLAVRLGPHVVVGLGRAPAAGGTLRARFP